MSTALFIYSLASLIIGIACAVASVLTLKANATYFKSVQAERKYVADIATGTSMSKVEAEQAADKAKGAQANAERAAKDAAECSTDAAEMARLAAARAASVTPTFLQEVYAPMTSPIFHFPEGLERDCE